MTRSICFALLATLPTSALAWDILPQNRGAVTLTSIVDITVITQTVDNIDLAIAPPGYTTYWIAFADADVGAVCRQIAGFPADEADTIRRNAGTLNQRYVLLEWREPDRDHPVSYLPVALFARANNQQVRVKIRYDNGICSVTWFQTCADPANCVPPPR